MSVTQIVLLLVFYGIFSFLTTSPQLTSYGVRVFLGWVVGMIMGDVSVGLSIGATMTLMSLGVGGFGGSAVPNYNLGTILGIVFAVTTNDMANGLTVAVTVSMFGTVLSEINKLLGSFFVHKAMDCNEKGDFHGIGVWVWLAYAVNLTVTLLPVAIAITVGADVITAFLNLIPAWFNAGMKVAGGILPGLGFAILMRYMPTKQYGVFMIVGFVLAAYMNLPMLPVAGLAVVPAYLIYQNAVEKEQAKSAGLSNVAGGMEDE